MPKQSNSQRVTRFLVIAAALVIIIGGINQAEPVLASVLVAVFLAVIGTPPVLWLEQKRVPSIAAVLIIVAGMITIMLIIGVVSRHVHRRLFCGLAELPDTLTGTGLGAQCGFDEPWDPRH